MRIWDLYVDDGTRKANAGMIIEIIGGRPRDPVTGEKGKREPNKKGVLLGWWIRPKNGNLYAYIKILNYKYKVPSAYSVYRSSRQIVVPDGWTGPKTNYTRELGGDNETPVYTIT